MTDQPQDPPALQCLRCRTELGFKGTQRFHHGRRWGVLGDLGELFVEKAAYDVYACPRCGHVEFFEEGMVRNRVA